MEEKKEVKISEEVLVVSEYPKQEVTAGMSEDGKTKITFVTTNEALTEILTRLRNIDKRL